jgi:hypothetical protein
MPVHVEEMTSEVTIVAGDLPLTPAQIDTLVELVIRRLAERERASRRAREATAIRRNATPPVRIGE